MPSTAPCVFVENVRDCAGETFFRALAILGAASTLAFFCFLVYTYQFCRKHRATTHPAIFSCMHWLGPSSFILTLHFLLVSTGVTKEPLILWPLFAFGWTAVVGSLFFLYESVLSLSSSELPRTGVYTRRPSVVIWQSVFFVVNTALGIGVGVYRSQHAPQNFDPLLATLYFSWGIMSVCLAAALFRATSQVYQSVKAMLNFSDHQLGHNSPYHQRRQEATKLRRDQVLLIVLMDGFVIHTMIGISVINWVFAFLQWDSLYMVGLLAFVNGPIMPLTAALTTAAFLKAKRHALRKRAASASSTPRTHNLRLSAHPGPSVHSATSQENPSDSPSAHARDTVSTTEGPDLDAPPPPKPAVPPPPPPNA